MATHFMNPTSTILGGWNPVPGGTNNDADVLTNDGDTSFVQLSYSNAGTDLYGFTYDVPVPDEGEDPTILLASFVGRASNTNGAGSNISQALLRIAGVDYISAVQNVWSLTSYQSKFTTWPTNPATGVAWTRHDLDLIQGFGMVKPAGQQILGNIRITQARVQVSTLVEAKRNRWGRGRVIAVAGTRVSRTPSGRLYKVA